MKRTYNKVISGVCGGIARQMNIDPFLIRLLTFACWFMFPIATIIVYFIITFSTDQE
jgi:phage shock protein PspC (stress-responsive transcriptional regulator)